MSHQFEKCLAWSLCPLNLPHYSNHRERNRTYDKEGCPSTHIILCCEDLAGATGVSNVGCLAKLPLRTCNLRGLGAEVDVIVISSHVVQVPPVGLVADIKQLVAGCPARLYGTLLHPTSHLFACAFLHPAARNIQLSHPHLCVIPGLGKQGKVSHPHLCVRGKLGKVGRTHLCVRGKLGKVSHPHLCVRGKLGKVGCIHLCVMDKLRKVSHTCLCVMGKLGKVCHTHFCVKGKQEKVSHTHLHVMRKHASKQTNKRNTEREN